MLKLPLILLAIGAAGASVVAAHLRVLPPGDFESKTSDQIIGASNSDRLVVDIPYGQLVLIADNSGDMKVHAVRSAKRPLSDQSRRWLNDSYLTAENRNGVLSLRDHPFGADVHRDVSGNNDHRGDQDIRLELQVHVPASLIAKISVSAGVADVRGHFRSLDATVSAGTLTTDSVRSDGDLALHVGAGQLDVTLGRQSRGGSKFQVGAGEVKVVVPAGSDADLSADVAIGDITGLPKSGRSQDDIHFGDRRHGRVGSGDSKVGIHVGTGSIKVESADRLLAMAIPGEYSSDHEMSQDESSFDKVDKGDLNIDADLDRTVRESVASALAEATKALKSVQTEIDLTDLPVDVRGDLEDLGPTMSKALATVGPAVQKALKTTKPEIDRAIRRAIEAIQRANHVAGI